MSGDLVCRLWKTKGVVEDVNEQVHVGMMMPTLEKQEALASFLSVATDALNRYELAFFI